MGLENSKILDCKTLERIKGGKEVLKNAESIDLSSKEISEIASETFLELSNLKKLNLEENQLTRIQKHTFRGLINLIELNLNKNQIWEIDQEAFAGLVNLKELRLCENKLNFIRGHFFCELIALERLYLGENRIEDIDQDAFTNLGNLIDLKMYSNQLKSVNSQMFRKLINLKIMNLNQNQIENIDQDAFANLGQLVSLGLQANKLTVIQNQTFQFLHKLEELGLRTNQISDIDDQLFANLQNLKTLTLWDNNITKIKGNTFRGQINLEQLNFSENKIEEIAAEAFANLQNLKELRLFKNQLRKIEEKTLRGLEKLQTLELDCNKISEINRELFQDLKVIKCIDLDNNPLVCVSYYDDSPLPSYMRKPTTFTSDWLKFFNQFPQRIEKNPPSSELELNKAAKNESTNDQGREELLEKIKQLEQRLQSQVSVNQSQESKAKCEYDRYEKKNFLGFGGFGTVFKVQDKNTNLTKAMKLIQKTDPTAQTELNSFVLLSHENILRYFDHFDHEVNNEMYTCIILEFCEKGDLANQINVAKKSEEKKISENKIVNWMTQAANGLEYLHRIKIVHRDIKPRNLLLTDKDVLKIGDLGLTKSVEQGRLISRVGSPAYMSPEQHDGDETYQEFPFKTDVWALGCVLFELINLEIAFKDGPSTILEPMLGQLGIFADVLPRMLEQNASSRLSSKELVDIFREL